MDTLEKLMCHISIFLDEFEAQFDNDPAQLSHEMMCHYIEAAKDLEKIRGRIHHRIEEVTDYLIFTQAI